MRARDLSENDLLLQVVAYADRLAKFPAPIVCQVIRDWPEQSGDAHRWWPSYPDLREAIEAAVEAEQRKRALPPPGSAREGLLDRAARLGCPARHFSEAGYPVWAWLADIHKQISDEGLKRPLELLKAGRIGEFRVVIKHMTHAINAKEERAA